MNLFEKDTGLYRLTFQFNEKKERHEFLVKSLQGGGHSAVHTCYNLLNDDGLVVSTPLITVEIAKAIMNKFDKQGDTEAFNIYLYELENRGPDDVKPEISPENIRHHLTAQEQSFTATGVKLYYHWPVFKKMSETGYGSILRATMTNHQVCSSRCPYCSTIARNQSDSISITEAKDFVSQLYHDQAMFNRQNFKKYNDIYRNVTGSDIRLRGLILSGGGQPNLWPYFEEFVRWLSTLEIDLGLITNGFPRNVSEDVYRRFKWIRISITPEDASPFYTDHKFNNQYIPASIVKNRNITLGLSYVYGPWTTEDMLVRLNEACNVWGADYCRLLTDCNLTRTSQLRAHQKLADHLFELGYIEEDGRPRGRLFHQLKFHGKQSDAISLWEGGQCYLQIYNVFWDTTGHDESGSSFCYPCDSITVLSEEKTHKSVNASQRRFNSEKWGTVRSAEVYKLFKEKIHPFFDPRSLCTSCLFMKNNQVVKDLIQCRDYSQLILPKNLEHINFM